MRAGRFSGRSTLFVFALITVAAYGLLLPLLGFYWDDWPFAWIAQFQGPSEFLPAFQGFRPFLGPIFALTTSLVPTDPLAWQIIGVVVRLISGVAAWFALGQIWPQERWLRTAGAMLFLVFPGYSQQWVALTHVNQEWISLIAYLFSFGLSVRALRMQRHQTWTKISALALLALALLPTEYFLGLEILRPIFFWSYFVGERQPRRRGLVPVLRAWLPYLLLWSVNAAWLLYYYRSGLYISYGIDAAPGALGFSQLGLGVAETLWKMAFYAWFQIIPLTFNSITLPSSIGTLGVVLISFFLLALYLRRLDISHRDNPEETDRADAPIGSGRSRIGATHARWAIAAGLIGILAGRLPSLAAGLPLTLQSSFDRLTISMMLGAALFVAGLLQLLLGDRAARDMILAGIVALAIGQQFFNANIFRRDWSRQNEIYWQFAWRVPGMLPDTAILTHQMPLDYETDLAMTAAINWMYARPLDPPHLPYAMIFTEKRLGGKALPNLNAGVPIRLPFRTMEFRGSTSQAIVVHVPADGCLHVFDPTQGDVDTYSILPEAVAAAIPLSDTGRILAAQPSPDLSNPPFQNEPAHTWCYFYEKAELARQLGEWDVIVSLRSEAADAGFSPTNPFEWLPFIEAEARVGDLAWATAITQRTLGEESKLKRGLCGVWNPAELNSDVARMERMEGIRTELGCAP